MNSSKLSKLQRNILRLMISLEENCYGPVCIRVIETTLKKKQDNVIYTSSLRQSCIRMRKMGLVSIIDLPGRKLSLELTKSGRSIAVFIKELML